MGSKWALAGGGFNAQGILNSVHVPERTADVEALELQREAVVARACTPNTLGGHRPIPSGSPFALFKPSEPSAAAEPTLNKEQATRKLRVTDSRRWAEVHGRRMPPPTMNKDVEQLVQEWFSLVDQDGAKTLHVSDLRAALKSARVPCTRESVGELLKLMDINQDGSIEWTEFRNYLSQEVESGKDVLAGQLTLPSGQDLPLGSMLHKLRRDLVMGQFIKGGQQRRKAVRMARSYVSAMTAVAQGALEHERSAAREGTAPVKRHKSTRRSTSIKGIKLKRSLSEALVRNSTFSHEPHLSPGLFAPSAAGEGAATGEGSAEAAGLSDSGALNRLPKVPMDLLQLPTGRRPLRATMSTVGVPSKSRRGLQLQRSAEIPEGEESEACVEAAAETDTTAALQSPSAGGQQQQLEANSSSPQTAAAPEPEQPHHTTISFSVPTPPTERGGSRWGPWFSGVADLGYEPGPRASGSEAGRASAAATAAAASASSGAHAHTPRARTSAMAPSLAVLVRANDMARCMTPGSSRPFGMSRQQQRSPPRHTSPPRVQVQVPMEQDQQVSYEGHSPRSYAPQGAPADQRYQALQQLYQGRLGAFVPQQPQAQWSVSPPAPLPNTYGAFLVRSPGGAPSGRPSTIGNPTMLREKDRSASTPLSHSWSPSGHDIPAYASPTPLSPSTRMSSPLRPHGAQSAAGTPLMGSPQRAPAYMHHHHLSTPGSPTGCSPRRFSVNSPMQGKRASWQLQQQQTQEVMLQLPRQSGLPVALRLPSRSGALVPSPKAGMGYVPEARS